jgi:hypothetical protein
MASGLWCAKWRPFHLTGDRYAESALELFLTTDSYSGMIAIPRNAPSQDRLSILADALDRLAMILLS